MEIWQTPTLSPDNSDDNTNNGGNGTTPSPGQPTQSSALVSCVGGIYQFNLYYRPVDSANHLAGELATMACFQILMLPVSDDNPVTLWDTELGAGTLLKIVDLSTETIKIPMVSDYIAGSINDRTNNKVKAIVGGKIHYSIQFIPPAQPDDNTKKWKVFFFKCDPSIAYLDVAYKAMYHNLSNVARFSPQTFRIRVDVADMSWSNYFKVPVDGYNGAMDSIKDTVTGTLYANTENKDFAVTRDFEYKGPMGTTYRYVNRESSINTLSVASNWQSIKIGGN